MWGTVRPHTQALAPSCILLVILVKLPGVLWYGAPQLPGIQLCFLSATFLTKGYVSTLARNGFKDHPNNLPKRLIILRGVKYMEGLERWNKKTSYPCGFFLGQVFDMGYVAPSWVTNSPSSIYNPHGRHRFSFRQALGLSTEQ